MAEFVILCIATEEETLLTHVKIEAFQTAIAEANNRIFFADVTFCLEID